MYENYILLMIWYVARKYDNSYDIKMILNELKMSTLENPDTLDSAADDLDKDIYKGYPKEYIKDNNPLTRSAKTLYLLVLVQHINMEKKEENGWQDQISENSFQVDTGNKI